MFPPTESISAHRKNTVGGPGHTALGHLTPPFVQITALQVQIQSFKAGEYFGAETSHPHYDNLAFATT